MAPLDGGSGTAGWKAIWQRQHGCVCKQLNIRNRFRDPRNLRKPPSLLAERGVVESHCALDVGFFASSLGSIAARAGDAGTGRVDSTLARPLPRARGDRPGSKSKSPEKRPPHPAQVGAKNVDQDGAAGDGEGGSRDAARCRCYEPAA